MHVVDINFGTIKTEASPTSNINGARAFCKRVHEAGSAIGMIRRKENVRLVSMNRDSIMAMTVKLLEREDLPDDFTLYYFQRRDENINREAQSSE